GTQKPRRTPRTDIFPPRLELQNRPTCIYSAEPYERPPKVNICIPILRGHSTRPKGWVEVLYFRNKAVLGLPVSTTSYSRHVVSTIQSPISTADNDRSLTDSDGAKTTRNPVLLSYLYIIITPRPVSHFHITFNNSGTVI